MAEAFDLILCEYGGYTDDTLLDVTLDRIRQMATVISERRVREETVRRRWQLNVAEVHARTLAAQLAGLAQDKQQARAMFKAAESIEFLTGDEKKPRERELPSTEQVMAAFGVRGRAGG